MDETSQIAVPPSFIALFAQPGSPKLRESRTVIAVRYELCEDLASWLTETAKTQLWDLGITEDDVLERIHRGLRDAGSGLDEPEAQWVTRRLAELLGWAAPRLGDAT